MNNLMTSQRPTETGTYRYKMQDWDGPIKCTVHEIPRGLVVRFATCNLAEDMQSLPEESLWEKVNNSVAKRNLKNGRGW